MPEEKKDDLAISPGRTALPNPTERVEQDPPQAPQADGLDLDGKEGATGVPFGGRTEETAQRVESTQAETGLSTSHERAQQRPAPQPEPQPQPEPEPKPAPAEGDEEGDDDEEDEEDEEGKPKRRRARRSRSAAD